MTIDKNDFNPILVELRLEQSKELLKDCKPFDGPAYFQKVLKEHSSILENIGNTTANSLARLEYNRQRPNIILRQFINHLRK